ncbi:Uncharacterized protein dnl_52390 [Desulfonema limicola]|uniref:Uncharacterized protein n=1 Tax=Desulfonema limicola TaxID=45656 RepID=A0A975BCU9_9BACT|nr:Uncharacterized protein dnl_52390 [Desulfonema limicola]
MSIVLYLNRTILSNKQEIFHDSKHLMKIKKPRLGSLGFF